MVAARLGSATRANGRLFVVNDGDNPTGPRPENEEEWSQLLFQRVALLYTYVNERTMHSIHFM